tara:strand:+ start:254 stop:622 length:369 start_codon:yes stop_codon:yes gene_type:complete
MRFPWSTVPPPPPPLSLPLPPQLIDSTSTGAAIAAVAVSVMLTIVMAILCARASSLSLKMASLREQAKSEPRATVVNEVAVVTAPAMPKAGQLKKTTPTSHLAASFARCLGQGPKVGDHHLA